MNDEEPNPTVTVTVEYDKWDAENRDLTTVTRDLTLDSHEVGDLLEQALSGTLEGVDPDTIETEIQRRSEK